MTEAATDAVEVVVPAGELASGLNKVKEVIPKRSTLPILRFVHLSGSNGGGLVLQGSNLEQALKVDIPGARFREGPPLAAMLPLRPSLVFLNALLRDVKKGEKKEVKLTAAGEKLTLEVADVGTLEWEGLPQAADFPPLPEWGAKREYVVCDGPTLMQGLRAVLPAVAKEDSRPVLTSVGVENHSLVAADGFRLHIYENPEMYLGLPESEESSLHPPALIPGAAVAVMTKLFQGKNPLGVRFVVGVASNKAWFQEDGVCLCTQLVNGTFPNWRQLVPSQFTTKVSFSAPLMVQRVDMLGDEVEIMRVVTEPSAEKGAVLRLSAAADGHKWNLTMPIQTEASEKTGIAFNRRYVRDALRPFALCDLTYNTPSSPGVFRGDVKGLTIVVMPMFVQW